MDFDESLPSHSFFVNDQKQNNSNAENELETANSKSLIVSNQLRTLQNKYKLSQNNLNNQSKSNPPQGLQPNQTAPTLSDENNFRKAPKPFLRKGSRKEPSALNRQQQQQQADSNSPSTRAEPSSVKKRSTSTSGINIINSKESSLPIKDKIEKVTNISHKSSASHFLNNNDTLGIPYDNKNKNYRLPFNASTNIPTTSKFDMNSTQLSTASDFDHHSNRNNVEDNESLSMDISMSGGNGDNWQEIKMAEQKRDLEEFEILEKQLEDLAVGSHITPVVLHSNINYRTISNSNNNNNNKVNNSLHGDDNWDILSSYLDDDDIHPNSTTTTTNNNIINTNYSINEGIDYRIINRNKHSSNSEGTQGTNNTFGTNSSLKDYMENYYHSNDDEEEAEDNHNLSNTYKDNLDQVDYEVDEDESTKFTVPRPLPLHPPTTTSDSYSHRNYDLHSSQSNDINGSIRQKGNISEYQKSADSRTFDRSYNQNVRETQLNASQSLGGGGGSWGAVTRPGFHNQEAELPSPPVPPYGATTSISYGQMHRSSSTTMSSNSPPVIPPHGINQKAIRPVISSNHNTSPHHSPSPSLQSSTTSSSLHHHQRGRSLDLTSPEGSHRQRRLLPTNSTTTTPVGSSANNRATSPSPHTPNKNKQNMNKDINQILTIKAKELEEELETYRKENVNLKKLRKQQEESLTEAMKIREETKHWVENEKEKTSTWCEEQRQLAVKERRAAAKQAREAREKITTTPTRRERGEIEGLQATIEKLKIDHEVAIKKLKINERRLENNAKEAMDEIKRLRAQVLVLQEEKEELSQQIVTAKTWGIGIAGHTNADSHSKKKAGTGSSSSKGSKASSTFAEEVPVQSVPYVTSLRIDGDVLGNTACYTPSAARPKYTRVDSTNNIAIPSHSNGEGSKSRQNQQSNSINYRNDLNATTSYGLSMSRTATGSTSTTTAIAANAVPSEADTSITSPYDPSRYQSSNNTISSTSWDYEPTTTTTKATASATAAVAVGYSFRSTNPSSKITNHSVANLPEERYHLYDSKSSHLSSQIRDSVESTADSLQFGSSSRYNDDMDMPEYGDKEATNTATLQSQQPRDSHSHALKTSAPSSALYNSPRNHSLPPNPPNILVETHHKYSPSAFDSTFNSTSTADTVLGNSSIDFDNNSSKDLRYSSSSPSSPSPSSKNTHDAGGRNIHDSSESRHQHTTTTTTSTDRQGNKSSQNTAILKTANITPTTPPAPQAISSGTSSSNSSAPPSKQILPNGTQILRYRNGTIKEISLNGTVEVKFLNGDIKRTMEGRIEYYYAQAQTTHTTLADGVQIYVFPNKQIETHYPNGIKEIIFPDKTKKVIHSDGIQESIFPDGVRVREYPDGRKEVIPSTTASSAYNNITT